MNGFKGSMGSCQRRWRGRWRHLVWWSRRARRTARWSGAGAGRRTVRALRSGSFYAATSLLDPPTWTTSRDIIFRNQQIKTHNLSSDEKAWWCPGWLCGRGRPTASTASRQLHTDAQLPLRFVSQPFVLRFSLFSDKCWQYSNIFVSRPYEPKDRDPSRGESRQSQGNVDNMNGQQQKPSRANFRLGDISAISTLSTSR